MSLELHERFDKILSIRKRPSDLIPVIAYDESTGVFLCDDGHIGVVYMGDPLIGADDTTAEMLKSSFSLPLPASSFIQISLIATPDINQDTFAYEQRRVSGIDRLSSEETKRLLESYYRRRSKYIQNGAFEPLIPSTGVKVLDRKVIITLKYPYKGMQPKEDEIEQLAEQGAKLIESLQATGLYLRRVDQHGYLKLAYRLTHMFEPTKTDQATDLQVLKEQVFEPGDHIKATKDSLVLNEKEHVQVLSVSRWPKENSLALMMYMLGDPMGANNQLKMPYHINLTMHYPDQYSKVSSMRQKSGMINYQAFGPMLRFVPKLALKKNGMDVLINAIEQGATVVEASLSLAVYGRNREESSLQVSAFRSYLQSFDLTMGEERRILTPVFWNMFPLFPTKETIKNTFRFKTLAVEHALTFAPLLGEWKGTKSEGPGHAMMFTSRRGQLMSLDLHDSFTNYNGIIFAESGSGKSFFTQQIIIDYLSIGAKVWVIDVGRSYYKLAKVLKGTFMEFKNTSNICLNPFSLISDIDNDVELIQILIEKMAAPKDGLDDYRRSRIEEAIKAVWGAMGPSATITDVADYLNQQPDSRVSDIGSMLYRFTRHGSLGYWFDGINNLDLSQDLVVLELEELKESKDLQQVVLIQVLTAIYREMFINNTGRPGVIIMDESWDLLNDPIIARFLEHVFRRIRKSNGSAIVVTQSIADLYGSASGRAIADNSAFKFILRQNAESISKVEKEGYLAIGDYGFNLMRTVHTIRNSYSEVMVYSNQGLGIARVVVDRFNQVLFSTSGNERSVILEAISNGVEPLDAIENYIEQYG